MSEPITSPSAVQTESPPTFEQMCEAAVSWWPALSDVTRAAIIREQQASGIRAEIFAYELAQFPTYGEYQGERPTATEPESQPTPEQLLAAFGRVCQSSAALNYELGRAAAEYLDAYLSSTPNAKRSEGLDRLAEAWYDAGGDDHGDGRAEACARLRQRVYRLLHCHHAVTLLAPFGRTDELPFGVARELDVLVRRETGETFERWHVIPHVAAECEALVERALVDGMSREQVAAAALALVTQSAALEAERTTAAADQSKGNRSARRHAEKAQDRADRLSRKLARRSQQPETEPEPVTHKPAPKLSPEQSTAAEVGAMAAELIVGADSPVDALEAELVQLKASGELDRAGTAAVDAALVVLKRRTQSAMKPASVA